MLRLLKNVVMKKVSFFLVSFVLLSQAVFGQTDVDFMEQVKRNARVNSHIEKNMSGKVVSHLYKGLNQALVGVIFKSDAGDHYHVSIKRPEGVKVFPFLEVNKKVQVTLTGDEKLLDEIMYYTSEFITIQNKLDIRLKGIAHLKPIQTNKGSYTLGKWSYFSDKPIQETFLEDVAIVKKKKVKGTHWAYIMENDDTIMVPYRYDELLKGRKKATYIKMRSMSSNGIYFKSPNTYEVLAGVPFRHDRAQRSSREILVAKPAIIMEKGHFEYLNDLSDSRGMFNAIQVKKGDDTLKLYFNPKNGERIRRKLQLTPVFDGYFKTVDKDKRIMYAMIDTEGTTFFNNSTSPLIAKSNYLDNQVEYKGKITKVEFGRPDNGTDLKNFVINDSIYVSVNQIVALNIQKMVELGKDISVKGYLRREIPGEINMNGYSILAANAITLESKTYKQIIQNIKKKL